MQVPSSISSKTSKNANSLNNNKQSNKWTSIKHFHCAQKLRIIIINKKEKNNYFRKRSIIQNVNNCYVSYTHL